MNPLLCDLCHHQAWADAEHWRAIEEHPAAAGDTAIRNRLHHIHLVQRVFVWAVGDRTGAMAVTTPDAFGSLSELKAYARGALAAVDRFVASVSEPRLNEHIAMPWFTNPPLSITVTEALTQCAMHSHYHRGQNAARLRELGGAPPLTDLIAWYWRGRPRPDWAG
ncbi:MAG: damage-inducible protein DinB [Acidobacteria bacterium]|nr:damage-inducible protein DinB [Acidobacteriota bacterium]